jgi:hypothetical protein
MKETCWCVGLGRTGSWHRRRQLLAIAPITRMRGDDDRRCRLIAEQRLLGVFRFRLSPVGLIPSTLSPVANRRRGEGVAAIASALRQLWSPRRTSSLELNSAWWWTRPRRIQSSWRTYLSAVTARPSESRALPRPLEPRSPLASTRPSLAASRRRRPKHAPPVCPSAPSQGAEFIGPRECRDHSRCGRLFDHTVLPGISGDFAVRAPVEPCTRYRLPEELRADGSPFLSLPRIEPVSAPCMTT